METEVKSTTMSMPTVAMTGAPVTELLLTKVAAMLVLGCGSLIAGMMPVIVKRCRKRSLDTKRGITSSSSLSSNSVSASETAVPQGLLTSLLLCFGGGVLLFTTFLHLAPEVRESVERHQSNGTLSQLGSLSLAELLFCGGFFFVYLVEETVHAALTHGKHEAENLLYRTISVRRCNNASHSEASSASGRDKEESKAERTEKNRNLPIFVLANPPSEVTSEVTKCDSKYDLESLSKKKINAHSHSHSHLSSENSLRGLLTVLALSFHAIFEGLAVGLEPALGSVVYLAAAIATHKLVIAFCVGMELYCAKASTRTIFGYLSVFSLVTPLGIIIGVALGQLKNDSDTLGPTPTILQGMAAGTLLYVVFFEVLARERANDKSGLLQLLAILIGFMLMLGLQIATAHSHDHGAHSHGAHHETEDSHHDASHSHQTTTSSAIDAITTGVTTVVDYVTSTSLST